MEEVGVNGKRLVEVMDALALTSLKLSNSTLIISLWIYIEAYVYYSLLPCVLSVMNYMYVCAHIKILQRRRGD